METLASSCPETPGSPGITHLAELRRTYDLRGDQSTSISLHLRRDNKGNGQP